MCATRRRTCGMASSTSCSSRDCGCAPLSAKTASRWAPSTRCWRATPRAQPVFPPGRSWSTDARADLEAPGGAVSLPFQVGIDDRGDGTLEGEASFEVRHPLAEASGRASIAGTPDDFEGTLLIRGSPLATPDLRVDSALQADATLPVPGRRIRGRGRASPGPRLHRRRASPRRGQDARGAPPAAEAGGEPCLRDRPGDPGGRLELADYELSVAEIDLSARVEARKRRGNSPRRGAPGPAEARPGAASGAAWELRDPGFHRRVPGEAGGSGREPRARGERLGGSERSQRSSHAPSTPTRVGGGRPPARDAVSLPQGADRGDAGNRRGSWYGELGRSPGRRRDRSRPARARLRGGGRGGLHGKRADRDSLGFSRLHPAGAARFHRPARYRPGADGWTHRIPASPRRSARAAAGRVAMGRREPANGGALRPHGGFPGGRPRGG